MGVLSWQDKHGGTGITTNKKAGRGNWTPGAVYHILTDPAYKGEGHYGKTTKDADGRRIVNPQDHWIAVPLPPILEAEEWDEIQAQLRSNRKYATRNLRNQYLLAGCAAGNAGRACMRAHGGVTAGPTHTTSARPRPATFRG